MAAAPIALPYRTLPYSRWFVRGANIRTGGTAGQHTAILKHKLTTYINVPLASHNDFCLAVANAVQTAHDHPLGPGGIFETAEPCPALGVPCAFLYFDLRLNTLHMQRAMTPADILHGATEMFKGMAQFITNTLWTHWQQSGEFDRQCRRRFIQSLSFVVSHVPELQRNGTEKRVRMVCRGLPVPAVFAVKLLDHMSTDAHLSHMATLTLSMPLQQILESMIIVPRRFGMDMLLTEMPVPCPECGTSAAGASAAANCFMCQGECYVRGGEDTAFQHASVFAMDVSGADAAFTTRDIPSLSLGLAYIHSADLIAMHSIRPGLDITSERPVWTLTPCPGRDNNAAAAAIDAVTWSSYVSAITLYVTTRLTRPERTSVQRRLQTAGGGGGGAASSATLSTMSDAVFEARGQAMKRSFDNPEQSGWREVRQDDGTPIWACAERICALASSVWGKQATLGPGDTVMATGKRSLTTPCVLADARVPDAGPDTRIVPAGALGFPRNYGVLWLCGGDTQFVPELMLPNTVLRPRGIGTLVRVQVPTDDGADGVAADEEDTWHAVFRANATTGVLSVVDRQGKTSHISSTSCAIVTVVRAAPVEGSEVALTTDMQIDDTDLYEGTVGQVVRMWHTEDQPHQFHMDVEWPSPQGVAIKSTHTFDPFGGADGLPFEMVHPDMEEVRTSIPICVNDVLVEAAAARKTVVQPSVSVHEPSNMVEHQYRRMEVTGGTTGQVALATDVGTAPVLVVDWGGAHIREAIVMSSEVKGVVLFFTPLSVACLPIALSEVSAADRPKTPLLYITCATHYCVNLIGSDVAFTRHTSARLRIAVTQVGLVPMCTCECQTQKHHRRYGMTCPEFAKHQKRQGVCGPEVRNAIRVSSSLHSGHHDPESRALSDMVRREFRMLTDLFTPCATQDDAMRRLFASHGGGGRADGAAGGGGGTMQFLNSIMSAAAIKSGGSVHSMLTPVMEGALGCIKVTEVRPTSGRNVRRRVGDAALHGFATSNTRTVRFSNASTGSHIEIDMGAMSCLDPVEAVHRTTRVMMEVMAERANGMPPFGGGAS